MIVYLMRHGQAGSGPEAERELTEEGAAAVERVAARCRAGGASPRLVLASTYRRAVQTAEIAARVLGCPARVERTTTLLPYGSPFDFWELVRERGPEGDLLVAAHEPLLGSVAAFLLDTPALKIRFGTASAVAIEVERWSAQPNGSLLWMLTPALA